MAENVSHPTLSHEICLVMCLVMSSIDALRLGTYRRQCMEMHDFARSMPWPLVRLAATCSYTTPKPLIIWTQNTLSMHAMCQALKALWRSRQHVCLHSNARCQ